jgi:(E)-4-hydroxy-3-methylbut-2-enyl-diphosphate synthase
MIAQPNPFEYERRSTRPVLNMGGNELPVVVADLGERSLQELLPIRGKLIPDYFLSGNRILDKKGEEYPVINLEEYLFESTRWGRMKFIRTNKMEFDRFMDTHPEIITKLKQTRKTVLILESFNKNPFAELRAFFMSLETHIWKVPVILYRRYKKIYSKIFRLRQLPIWVAFSSTGTATASVFRTTARTLPSPN